ncbi:MAG: hypothetical protein CM15mP93_04520 [Thiotrichaceae bacterium]|nr:MAG: hypothetical protein CM15mP93_04520 [Thiotrichaceae bacterium]
MKGPNLKGTTNLAKSLNIPVIASGGISSENDVMNYLSNEKYGINGVIIGRALYENKISFSKLINKLHKNKMSLTKRIIPCLDVNNGRVVKGINFKSLRDAGDPVEVARDTMTKEQMR